MTLWMQEETAGAAGVEAFPGRRPGRKDHQSGIALHMARSSPQELPGPSAGERNCLGSEEGSDIFQEAAASESG